MITISSTLNLAERDFDTIWNLAVREAGFMRAEPRRAWTTAEKKQAIRAWVGKIIGDKVKYELTRTDR